MRKQTEDAAMPKKKPRKESADPQLALGDLQAPGPEPEEEEESAPVPAIPAGRRTEGTGAETEEWSHEEHLAEAERIYAPMHPDRLLAEWLALKGKLRGWGPEPKVLAAIEVVERLLKWNEPSERD
jgi:hypothetical protein